MSKRKAASKRGAGRVGGGGAGNPNSLANLPNLRGDTTATAWKPGDAPAWKHGLRSTVPLPIEHVSAELGEIMTALAESAPVRDGDGNLPIADHAAVEVAARALHRSRRAHAWGDATGRFDERTGNPKPITRYERECDRDLKEALDALGMTPRSRAALGLDVARTAQAASSFAEQVADVDVIEGNA